MLFICFYMFYIGFYMLLYVVICKVLYIDRVHCFMLHIYNGFRGPGESGESGESGAGGGGRQADRHRGRKTKKYRQANRQQDRSSERLRQACKQAKTN